MSHQFIQVPPDSTGKKTLARVYCHLLYDNGTTRFQAGDPIVGVTSGVTGQVVFAEGSAAAGTLHVMLDVESGTIWVDGENLQSDGVTYATANGIGEIYYMPGSVIMGGNSGHSAAYVDSEGQLYTRFGEGAPLFDAFGRMQVSNLTTIGDYVYTYDKLPNVMSETTSGAASGTYLPNVPAVNMSVTDSPSDAIVRSSDLYHQYQPGVSHLIEMTVWCGDSGKTGNKRRWGYFDLDNGVYFELDGTTLYAVVRSKSTGSIVETRIAQADWNGDQIDGSRDSNNISGYDLDLTKTNIFWMDVEWLGGGRIRFGTYINGKRIICHSHYHANEESYSNMGTGSLPVRWENRNTGFTSGTSELFVISATVKTEGDFKPEGFLVSDGSALTTISTSASFIPLFSGRMKETFKGKPNRKITIVEDTYLYNNGSVPVEIAMIFNPTLTGATWADDLGSPVATIQDITATALTGGLTIKSVIIAPNESKLVDWNFDLGKAEGKLFRKADVTATPNHLTVAAKLLDGTSGTCNVKAIMNWKEY